MNKESVKELIQKELNTPNLTDELNKITTGKSRESMLNDYGILHQKLGGIGASKRAANLIVDSLKK